MNVATGNGHILTFLVLEGFSGTGKTSLADLFERDGWLRITESAHMIPQEIPVAEKANTYSDYALIGQVLTATYRIAEARGAKRIVAEGYFLSDLAYFKIRHALKLSQAYPILYTLTRSLLQDSRLRPDLYILLRADEDEIIKRQAHKVIRDRLQNRYFMTKYYEFIREFHQEFDQPNYVEVNSNSNDRQTYERIQEALQVHNLAGEAR